LKNLGQLSTDFDTAWLYDLAKHNNSDVRLLAVKNIGKLADEQHLAALCDISKNDNDTNVQREAISGIGRMRSQKAKPFLILSAEVEQWEKRQKV